MKPEASQVTAEVLQKVAKRLGLKCLKPSRLMPGDDFRWNVHDSFYPTWSDGDLLLAILNKAAENPKLYPEVSWSRSQRKWFCTMSAAYPEFVGETTLEAAMLAFAQLPESP